MLRPPLLCRLLVVGVIGLVGQVGLSCVLSPALAGEPSPAMDEAAVLKRASAIYLDVTVTTWMRRGRSLTLIEPNLRTKLTTAGFTVVREESQPHELILKVDYKETQGKRFRVDTFGTDITCVIDLEHAELGSLLDLTIRESSGSVSTGTPPYLEALERFEANPYYYFLAEIIRGRVVAQRDTTEGLIHGLNDLLVAQARAGRARGTDHGLTSEDMLYATLAGENTIVELGRLKDRRAVPLLTGLLDHPEPRIRSLSVKALGQIGAGESQGVIERVAQHDADIQVREAAEAALAGMADVRVSP